MSRPRRIPGTRRGPQWPPGWQPIPASDLAARYGPGATVNFASAESLAGGPRSWLMQRQDVRPEGASRWFTQAAYRSREEAERAAKRWEQAGRTVAQMDVRTLEVVEVADPQPVSVYRVVSLADLIREGPMAVAHAVYDLVTSDHEWLLSCELGYAETQRLLAEIEFPS